jgi:hypothetical protein
MAWHLTKILKCKEDANLYERRDDERRDDEGRCTKTRVSA